MFYIAGFDNIGARYYYMLFRSGLAHEFGRMARRFAITRPAPASDIASRWRVETDDAGKPVNVDYFFLTPHDLVRRFSAGGALRLLGAWLHTLFLYLWQGTLFRSLGKTWKAVVLFYVLFSFPVFFVLGAAAAWGILALLDHPLPPLGQAGLAAATGFAALRLGVAVANKTSTNILLISLHVGALHARGRLPELERRIEAWAGFVRQQAAAEDWDEVLLVGHSSGVIAAADVAAALLRDPAPGRKIPLALLTLGSTDFAVSAFHRESYARRHRAALADVAASPDIVWIEYCSPYDFICIGPHDAISMSQIDLGGRARRGPIGRELDLRQSLSPESFRRMFFDLFARHFQYLKGNDRPADYSYFGIVCGAKRLA